MRRRWIGSLLLLAGASALAVGCGGGNSATGTQPPAPTAAGVSTVAGAPAPGDTVKVSQSALGQILTNAAGRTAYVFLHDTPASGKSACTGSCAQTWPAVTLSAGTPTKADSVPGALSLITRDDGTKQVTYNGQPLYLFSGDTAAGDTKGEGIGKIWFAARPGASPLTAPPAATQPAAASTSTANGGY